MTRITSTVVRYALAIACAIVFLAVASVALLKVFPSGDSPISDPIDFVAFYCASRVAPAADPYRAEPLRTCERGALAESHIAMIHDLVVPAPLPPYALRLLQPLTWLTFREASALWLSLSLGALCATIVLIRKITDAPLSAVAIALTFGVGLGSLIDGQIVPLMMCCLGAAAFALKGRRHVVAAVFALPLTLEPQIGAPVLLSLFIWESKCRRTLALGVLAFAAISLFGGGGLSRNVEYLRVVLPAQALSEGLEFGGQYSLSALLALLGMAAPLALAFGTASTVLLTAVSTFMAKRVALSMGDPAAILFVPAAFAVVGGTYVHIHQIAFALPLALMLYAASTRFRLAAMFALALVAVPWEVFGETAGLTPSHRNTPLAVARERLSHVAGGELLAETAWGVWVRSGVNDSRTTFEHVAYKLPTWAGLGFIIIFACSIANNPRLLARRTA